MASPPRRDRRTAILVLAVLVAFLLIVGVAAFYILNRGTPAGPAPFVDFGPPMFGNPGDATLNISEASRLVALANFRVSLRNLGAGTTLFDVELHVGTLFAQGGAVVSFEDLTSTGYLSVGDLFRLINLPTGADYSLILVYAPESRTVASATIPL